MIAWRQISEQSPSNPEIAGPQIKCGHQCLRGSAPHRAATLDDIMPVTDAHYKNFGADILDFCTAFESLINRE
jgi:hypothetical protein